MFCTDCGTKNSIDSKYCKECGAKINDGYRTMMLSLDDLRAIDDQKNQERLTKLLDMAFWHNEAGNLDAAVLACEAALAIHPHSTTAHSLLGTLYEKRGNDAKAVEHLQAVVTLNPDSAADAAKLDQLRRGVHVKAVAPPPLSRWIPPALAGISAVGMKEKLGGSPLPMSDGVSVRLPKLSPLLASAAVAFVVLVVGMLLIHASAPAPARTMIISSVPASAPLAPAISAAAPQAVNLPPMTFSPGTATHAPAVTTSGPDPFADSPGPVGRTTAILPAAPLPSVAKARPAPRRGSYPHSVASLPPLSLRVVPMSGDGGLAPMPVSMPPMASVAAVPEHTVVVSSLNSGVPQPAPVSSVAPHIHISIHNSPSAEHISLSDRDLPATDTSAPPASSGNGNSYQQTAINFQQQGDYRRAAASYERAIRAFQAQIASGRDTETASRALQACQTGLQICQQSR